MPNIKKAEYDGLKNQIYLLELRLKSEKYYSEILLKAYKEEIAESAKWKRYYDAVRETFKVEEHLEIPGCFSPMDTIEYIVKKQKEVNDGLDHITREMP